MGLHRAGRPCPQVQAYTYFGTCFCGNTYGDRMVSGLHQLRAACAAQETRLRCAVQMLTTASIMFHSGCPKKALRRPQGAKCQSRSPRLLMVAGGRWGCTDVTTTSHDALPTTRRRSTTRLHAPSAGQLMRRAGHTRRTTSPTRRSRPSSRQSYDSLYVDYQSRQNRGTLNSVKKLMKDCED